jgi:MFS family permease
VTAASEAPGRRSAPGRAAAAWRSGPLSVPGFRLLTAGQFTSTIGDYCYAVALPWLVLSSGGSAASLGIVLACYGIPRALLMVPAGSLADRFGSRRVMLASDFARCLLTAAFAALAAAHMSSLAAVAPVAALLGAFSALFLPASMAMMPSLVESSRLTSANAVYTGFVQAGSMIGPVIGGILVAATGPATAFAVDAGSYLVSAVTLGFISVVSATAGHGGAAPVADAAAGDSGPGSVWALLRQSRVLQIVLVVVLSANLALVGTTEVALPALAHARFGADGYGAVLTSVAVAGIIGALIVGRVGDRFRPAVLIAVAFVVAAAAIAAAPFIGGLPGLAAGMAVFGLGIGFDNVVSVTLIQRWAPPAMLGRVWGLLMLASIGSFPVATFGAGLLVRPLGPVPIFPISGVLLALSMGWGLSQREFRDFGTEPGPADS